MKYQLNQIAEARLNDSQRGICLILVKYLAGDGFGGRLETFLLELGTELTPL